MSHNDKPPAYPPASYDQNQGPYGGGPPQGGYHAQGNMGYGSPPPPGQGGYYPPQQGGYPPQQQGGYYQGQQGGYPPPQQGYYAQPQQQQSSSKDGCLGALLGAMACCCCLDCLF